MYLYLCTHIHNKTRKKCSNHSPCLSTEFVIVAGVYNCLPLPHAMLPVPSASPSAGHGSACGVAQTFIPEESKPWVVLPELNYSFPLTLITGLSGTEIP